MELADRDLVPVARRGAHARDAVDELGAQSVVRRLREVGDRPLVVARHH